MRLFESMLCRSRASGLVDGRRSSTAHQLIRFAAVTLTTAVVVAVSLTAGGAKAAEPGWGNAQLVTTVPVGGSVRNAAMNSDGSRLYTVGPAVVDGMYIATLATFDTATNTLVGRVALAGGEGIGDPTYVAVTPDGSRAYVGVAGGWVSVVDTALQTLITNIRLVPPGTVVGIAQGLATVASPDGKFIYETTYLISDGNYVTAVIDSDPASVTYNTVREWIPTSFTPTGMAFTPDGTEFYIMGASGQFRVYNATTRVFLREFTISPQNFPLAFTFSPDGQTMYLPYRSATSSLQVIDLTTSPPSVTASIPVGDDPRGVAVSPDGTRVFVSNSNQTTPAADHTVLVIDRENGSATFNTVIESVVVGLGPWGITMNPAGTRVYTPNWDGQSISVVATGYVAPPADASPTPVKAPLTPASASLSLDSNGGSCTTSLISGDAGAWVSLPVESACVKNGATLSGWMTRDGKLSFAPGAQVYLTGDNTLIAQWAPTTSQLGVSPTGEKPSVQAVKFTFVKWRGGKVANPKLLSGDSVGLTGRNALFTIVTKRPGIVRARDIVATRVLAARYGGTYGGVVKGNGWVKPRIVAVYLP
jgi:DNA-binding beta-propeller fold protein YncE